MPKEQIVQDAMQRLGDKAEMVVERFGPLEEAMLTACAIEGGFNVVIIVQGAFVDERGKVMQCIESRTVGSMTYSATEVAEWLDTVKAELLEQAKTVTEDGACADCGRGIDNGQS